ncbi:hypothetical protein JCM21714_3183 [Gracilibacillus boraciitolerans JCM 21714]|uniref:Uncharacterized protein n=1 Tax=Gracilibacillus boraciitolerans JCM 21714 TaxID=1298598 RepID=W4VLG9_9BACI|nr:hypothetical protein [Gracilibacillus boraciitolerans]GAE94052.1 hypothetical protein JCM21714_3183 [Gracilibacillus boraciitolerans JCM 21714]
MIGVLIATLIAMILYVVGMIITLSISKLNASRVMKHGLIILVIGYLTTGIIFYFAIPAITVPNMLLANIIVAAIFLPLFLYVIQPGKKVETSVMKPIVLFFSVGFIALIVIIVLGFTTLDDAHQSISVTEEEEAKPLTKDETPITVAPEFARNKIQKAMSVVPNPQFYDLGKLQVQKVEEEVVYVAPVEFAGFWKFLRGKETAGYFTISATNVNAQPEFHDSAMQYTNSSYFHKYVKRVIYNQYPQYIQSGEAQIEIDEDGKPWYVQTIYRPMHVTNKPNLNALKVVVIDPTSGDMKMFETNEAPDFIEGR